MPLAASSSLGMVAGDTAGTFVAAVDTSSGPSVRRASSLARGCPPATAPPTATRRAPLQRNE